MNHFLKPCLLLLSLLVINITHSQLPPVQKSPTGFTVTCKDHITELQVYSTGTIRVKKYPKEKTFDPQSLSVITKPASIPFSTKTKGDIVTLKTSELTVSLDTSRSLIVYRQQWNGAAERTSRCHPLYSF